MDCNNDCSIFMSIIIPVYNVSEYIEECLGSVIQQTDVSIEVILVDDGSTDDSASICKRYADMDNRVIYIQQSNSGVSVSRNRGIEVANGKYVTFVDPDDILQVNFVKEAYEKVGDNDFLIFNASYLTEVGEKKSDWYAPNVLSFEDQDIEELKRFLFLRGKDSRDFLYKDKYFIPFMGTSWMKVYKRKILLDNDIRFLKGVHPAEDVLFNFDYLEHCNKATAYKDSFYKYRTRLTSSTHAVRYDRYSNLRKYYNYLKTNYLEIGVMVEPIYIALFRHLWFVLSKQTFNRNCYKTYSEAEREYRKERDSDMVWDIISHVDSRLLPPGLRVIYQLYKNDHPLLIFIIRRIYDAHQKA